MAFGEVIGGFFADVFGQIIFEGLFKCVMVPVLRFPGAIIGWSIWRGRTFQTVWEKGNKFEQGTAGLVLYVMCGIVVAVIRSGS